MDWLGLFAFRKATGEFLSFLGETRLRNGNPAVAFRRCAVIDVIPSQKSEIPERKA